LSLIFADTQKPVNETRQLTRTQNSKNLELYIQNKPERSWNINMFKYHSMILNN